MKTEMWSAIFAYLQYSIGENMYKMMMMILRLNFIVTAPGLTKETELSKNSNSVLDQFGSDRIASLPDSGRP